MSRSQIHRLDALNGFTLVALEPCRHEPHLLFRRSTILVPVHTLGHSATFFLSGIYRDIFTTEYISLSALVNPVHGAPSTSSPITRFRLTGYCGLQKHNTNMIFHRVLHRTIEHYSTSFPLTTWFCNLCNLVGFSGSCGLCAGAGDARQPLLQSVVLCLKLVMAGLQLLQLAF